MHDGERLDVRLSQTKMTDPVSDKTTWRNELPTLAGRVVTLREPAAQDLGPLVDLLSLDDASRFGLDEDVSEVTIYELLDRVLRERASGLAFAYAITLSGARRVVGLVHVRQLDPSFEAAEWEWTIAPSSRWRGIFIEALRASLLAPRGCRPSPDPHESAKVLGSAVRASFCAGAVAFTS